MKILLTVLFCLSLPLIGADKKLTYSHTGLEGIAKDGIVVIVEDYSKYDKTFDKKAIENQIKLRLIQAEVKVVPAVSKVSLKPSLSSGFYLRIIAQPHPLGTKYGYSGRVKAVRTVTFEANGKKYYKSATVWDSGAIEPSGKLREGLNKHMDKFLLDYLKANPKKNED